MTERLEDEIPLSHVLLLDVLCTIFLAPVTTFSLPDACLLLSLAFSVCGGKELWGLGSWGGSRAGSGPTPAAAPLYPSKSRAGLVMVPRVSQHCSSSGSGSRSRVRVAKYVHTCEVAEAKAAKGDKPRSGFAQLFQQTALCFKAGLLRCQSWPGAQTAKPWASSTWQAEVLTGANIWLLLIPCRASWSRDRQLAQIWESLFSLHVNHCLLKVGPSLSFCRLYQEQLLKRVILFNMVMGFARWFIACMLGFHHKCHQKIFDKDLTF